MKSRNRNGTSGTEPGAAATHLKSILLVEDHPLMRAGLALMINRQPNLQVAGEAGSPGEAFALLAGLRVDLIVTDISMPGSGGIEFIKDLQVQYSTLPILVFSMHDEEIYAERALRAGARGYIMKENGGESLLRAIRKVLQGEVYVSPGMTARLLAGISGQKTNGSHSPFSKLSDREFEVYQLIGQGVSTRGIASKLNLSVKTVDVHRSNIRSKLGLDDATALIRHAVRWMESR